MELFEAIYLRQSIGKVKPDPVPRELIEKMLAAAAATQNLLLAATGLGLAAMWRTGPAALDPDVKAFLGLAPDQRLIGFIYVGCPFNAPLPTSRPSFEDRTVWLD